jgi:CheY-like chemotaxis protein
MAWRHEPCLGVLENGAGEGEAADHESAADRAQFSILVIEDEAPMRELLRLALEDQGYAVLVAADGAEGRAIALEQQPDIILCDVRMPGMSGHQVLAALRGDYQTRHIPFIFLTGSRESQSIRLGMAGGAADYLVKPFRPEELDDAIGACRRKLAWFDRALERYQPTARCA